MLCCLKLWKVNCLSRSSFKDAVESESDDEELLKVREKSSDEIKKENKEYQSWLKTAGKKLVSFVSSQNVTFCSVLADYPFLVL